MVRLLGLNDTNLQVLEHRYDANITVRGDQVTFRGEQQQIDELEKIFKELIYLLNKNGAISVNDVETVIDLVKVNGEPAVPKNIASQVGEEEL